MCLVHMLGSRIDQFCVCFLLIITDKKIRKAEALVAELSGSIRHIAIRTVAHLERLLRSFYLAMGPSSRVHSRGLMTFVASHVQRLGWEGQAVLDTQSWIEFDFWSDNVRSLNGALMRTEGGVKDLDVRDFVSDASDVMVSKVGQV